MGDSSHGLPSGRSNMAESEAQKYSKLFVFSGDNKAGMQGMDKELQAKVIYENSKNSAYFKRVAELDASAELRAAAMLQAFSKLDASSLRRLESLAHAKMLEYESRRSFERIVAVLDMDMFYAAVEIRDRPSLASLPVAVGGEGMISTSNYVARKFGVRAAMPGFIAKKLCPDLVFVPHNFDKYRAVAEVVRNVVKKYDPELFSHGLDEVYFDLTPYIHKNFPELSGSLESMRGKASEIVESIRMTILDYTRLTSSAGLAHNFSLAKVCADINKPNGQYMLPGSRDAVFSFLDPLSVRKIGGIGKVTEKLLSALGIQTVLQLRSALHKVWFCFGQASAHFLVRSSLGVGEEEGSSGWNQGALPLPRAPPPGGIDRKSMGCERTFSAAGVSALPDLMDKLQSLCESLSEDLQEAGLRGGRVTLKLKDTLFRLCTRCALSPKPVQSADSIFQVASRILEGLVRGEGGGMKVRLLGVSLSQLTRADGDVPAHRGLMKFFEAKRLGQGHEEGGKGEGEEEAGGMVREEGDDERYEIGDIDEAVHVLDEQGEQHEDDEVQIVCTTASLGPSTHSNPATTSSTLSAKIDNPVPVARLDDVSNNRGKRSRTQDIISRESSSVNFACPCCDRSLPSLLELNWHLDREHLAPVSKKKDIASFFHKAR